MARTRLRAERASGFGSPCHDIGLERGYHGRVGSRVILGLEKRAVEATYLAVIHIVQLSATAVAVQQQLPVAVASGNAGGPIPAWRGATTTAPKERLVSVDLITLLTV